MSSFAIIGLGRFGMTLARALARAGQEVIAIDEDPELVEQIGNDVTMAVRMDATDERTLRSQGVGKVDAAVVTIGEKFENNVLVTALLKSMGVTRVIARASTSIRQKILRHVGADEIISPEDESAVRLAQQLVSPGLISILEIGEGVSMVQMKAPIKFHNRRIVDIDLRRKYSVNLVAIKKRIVSSEDPNVFEEKVLDIPKPDDVIDPNDILILMGSDEALAELPTS